MTNPDKQKLIIDSLFEGLLQSVRTMGKIRRELELIIPKVQEVLENVEDNRHQ